MVARTAGGREVAGSSPVTPTNLGAQMSKSLDMAREYIGKVVLVKVDRPMGSKHPEYNYEYPINYGYIANTKAPDGEELDVYILGVDRPTNNFQGVVKAIIHRADDDDDKLVVMPEEVDLSDKKILESVNFQEQYFDSSIVR